MLSAVTAALSGERGFRARDKERDFSSERLTGAADWDIELIFLEELAFFSGDEPVTGASVRALF